jgi:ATP-dependent helicase HrpA
MLEELRVSLFAQPMKTAYPVSEKRVLRAMDALPADTRQSRTSARPRVDA